MTNKTSFLWVVTAVLAGLLVGAWWAANERFAAQEGPAAWPSGPGGEGVTVEGSLDARDASDAASPAFSAARGRGPRAIELDEPMPLATPSSATTRTRARPVARDDDERFAPAENVATWAVTVEDEAGRAIAGARVAAFRTGDGVPLVQPVAQAAVAKDGLAFVRVPVGADVRLVAFAPGHTPTERELRPENFARDQLAPFVLGRGASIAGRVTVAGEPLERAQLDAEPLASSLALAVEGGGLGWRMGRFVPTRASAQTDANGAYELHGLEAGEHQVKIVAVRQRDAAVDVARIDARRASSDSTGVDFVLPGARLELAFESENRPLCCVEVQIQAGDRQFMRTTDDAGRIAMRIQPALEYPIVATRSGYETRRVQLRGLADGDRDARTIELEPQTMFTNVEFDDEGTIGHDTATFTFHTRFAALDQPDFERTLERDRSTGRFRAARVPAGSWRVTVSSGWSAVGQTASGQASAGTIRANCDTDVLVDVPVPKRFVGTTAKDPPPIAVRVSVQPRGWLVVNAHTPDGTALPAEVRLFDLQGNQLETLTTMGLASFTVHSSRPARTVQGLFPTFEGSGSGPIEVRTQACAGIFDLFVSAPGHGESRRRVSIVTSQPTAVDVTLAPR